MPRKAKIDAKQLLTDVLANADIGELNEELQDRVSEFIAEVGGCVFCGRPATLLCDHIIGYRLGGYSKTGGPLIDTSSDTFTCDAPMCDQCSTNNGHIFWSGKDGGISTIDVCPEHAKNRVDLARTPIITAEDADKKRKTVWQFGVIRAYDATESCLAFPPPDY